MAKKKNSVSPVAPCKYPWLKKPNTKWKAEGEYQVAQVFDQDDPFVTGLEAQAEKEFKKFKANLKPAKAKKLKFVSPVKEDEDGEGEPTGNVRINFKSKTQFVHKETKEIVKITPKVFDASGKQIRNLPNIGNGSKLSVAFNPVPAVVKDEFYLTLWMNAVQLVELVEYGGDGSNYGFGKAEGGYSAADAEGSEMGDAPEDDDDDDATEF